MEESKRVLYSGLYKGHLFDIQTWAGTPLSAVWNQEKWRFLPGDSVIIEDLDGNVKKFVKGLC